MKPLETNVAYGPLRRPIIGSHGLHSDNIEWQPTESPGFWVKALFDDESSGARTTLMRIDPGAFAELHSHDQVEEILVLDGEFCDQHATYRPGDYCVRAIGAAHTAGSEEGCTVLLIYRS